jgi:hypothetical protein
MDFQQLLAKMVELDQPTPEMAVAEEPNEGNEFSGALVKAKAAGAEEFEVDGKKYKVKEDGSVEECPMDSMPSPMMNKPDTPPPSMTVNLNAQGMDDISELMKLMTKVNPDMINQPQGGMPPMPGVAVMPKISSIGDLGNLDSGPLKMLPDMDADNNMKPGGEMDTDYNDDGKLDRHEKDHADEKPLLRTLDLDKDGDHDMDDHDMEKKKEKEEAFGNSLDDSEPETMDIDAAIRNGDDIHKQKKSFSGKPYRGDNPMAAGAYESTDLRAQIRAELQQRLAEAKGAK